jgi:hypothetical protein
MHCSASRILRGTGPGFLDSKLPWGRLFLQVWAPLFIGAQAPWFSLSTGSVGAGNPGEPLFPAHFSTGAGKSSLSVGIFLIWFIFLNKKMAFFRKICKLYFLRPNASSLTRPFSRSCLRCWTIRICPQSVHPNHPLPEGRGLPSDGG